MYLARRIDHTIEGRIGFGYLSMPRKVYVVERPGVLEGRSCRL